MTTVIGKIPTRDLPLEVTASGMLGIHRSFCAQQGKVTIASKIRILCYKHASIFWNAMQLVYVYTHT